MVKTYLIVFIFTLNHILAFAQVGDQHSIEKKLQGRDDVIFFGGFEENYNNKEWESSWGIEWVMQANENEITPKTSQKGRSLRVNYPRGGVGPEETGTQFPIVFSNMAGIDTGLYQELYLRYYVMFEEGFDFKFGGKLPGLMGGGDSWLRSGGNQPDGTNGWTLRFMWRKNGHFVVYAYVPQSNNGLWGGKAWGHDIETGINAVPGTWHCIEQYVNVGSAGSDTGTLKVWIDGKECVNIDNMRFWNKENDSGKIGGIYFSTFHGGNKRTWAPDRDSYAQFDGFVVAKKRVGQ